MSTGDVRRPSLNKLSKAAATDKPEPEVIDSADETEDTPPAKGKPATENRPGARSAAKAATPPPAHAASAATPAASAASAP